MNNIERVLMYGINTSNQLVPVQISSSGDSEGLTVASQRLGFLGGSEFEEVWNNTPRSGPFSSNDDTILASATRNGNINSSDLTNTNHRGIHITIDITAIVGGNSITVDIQGRDNLSGQYYSLLTTAAIGAVSTTVLRIYPGLVAAAGLTANDILPRIYRASVTNGNATDITYSIGQSKVL